jgi:hypothetical protein
VVLWEGVCNQKRVEPPSSGKIHTGQFLDPGLEMESQTGTDEKERPPDGIEAGMAPLKSSI